MLFSRKDSWLFSNNHKGPNLAEKYPTCGKCLLHIWNRFLLEKLFKLVAFHHSSTGKSDSPLLKLKLPQKDFFGMILVARCGVVLHFLPSYKKKCFPLTKMAFIGKYYFPPISQSSIFVFFSSSKSSTQWWIFKIGGLRRNSNKGAPKT